MISNPVNHAEEFVKLLRSTLVTDNLVRKDSEAKLNSIEDKTRIALLLHVLMNEKEKDVLEIAALMLRRSIDRSSDVSEFDPNIINLIKTAIPTLCLSEQNSSVRNKLVDILGSLINLLRNEDPKSWPEIATFFYECLVQSNNPTGQLIGFRLLRNAPNIIRKFDGKNVSEIFKIINNTQTQNIDSVKALTSLLLDAPLKRIKPYIKVSLNNLFNSIKNSVNDDDVCENLLEELNLIIEVRPKLIKNYIPSIIELMIIILSSSQSENLKISAMEIIVCLAEKITDLFKTVAKDIFPDIVKQLLNHMAVISYDADWINTVYEESGEEIAEGAQSSLDRIACAVSYKITFPIIMDNVSPFFNSNLWQHKCVALNTISCIAEGCKKALKPYLPSVVDAIVPFIHDEHPRVVYTCINAIGQLCVDYSAYFKVNFHSKIFPAIISSATSCYPKIQLHAISCFANLMNQCSVEILAIYSDQIFEILHKSILISISNYKSNLMDLVLKNSLSSMAELAKCLKVEFVKYYPKIVPDILIIIRNYSANAKVYINCLDSLSDILSSVGIGNCRQDLNNVLELLRAFELAHATKDEDRNYQIEYLEIMAQIAKIYQEGLSPILPTLMPTILNLASQPIVNHIINSQIYDDNMSKAYTAHTEALTDKNTILLVLAKLVKKLKSGTLSYFEQIAECAIRNFNENSDDDIQMSCSKIFSNLLLNDGYSYQLQLWYKIFETFYLRLMNSEVLFNSENSFEGITQCIKVLGDKALSQDLLIKINQMFVFEIEKLINDIGALKPENYDTLTDFDVEDYDDDDEEEEDDDDYSFSDEEPEERVLSSIHDLQQYLLESFKDKYAPYYLQVNDLLVRMLECVNPTLKKWSLCLFINAIEYIPNDIARVSAPFLERARILNQDPDPKVQQAAVFLVGVVAQFSQNHHPAFLGACLPILVQIITGGAGGDDSKALVIANAICSVGKIMKHAPQLIGSFDAAVNTWISWLPVHEDEVDFILGYLLELIETKFNILVQNGNSDLFKILDSISIMLPFAFDEVSTKSINILSQIKAHFPDAFNSWFSNLQENHKKNIMNAQEIYAKNLQA